MSREENYFRNRKVERKSLPYDPLLSGKKKKPLIEIAKEKVQLDQVKELKVLSYSLRQYVKDLEEYEAKMKLKAERLSAKAVEEEEEEEEAEEEAEEKTESEEKTGTENESENKEAETEDENKGSEEK